MAIAELPALLAYDQHSPMHFELLNRILADREKRAAGEEARGRAAIVRCALMGSNQLSLSIREERRPIACGRGGLR